MKTKSMVQVVLVLGASVTASHAVAEGANIPASVVGTSIVTTLPPTMTTLVLAITLDEITALTSGNRLAAEEVQQIVVESLEDVAVYQAEGQIGGVLPAAIIRLRELIPGKANASDHEMVLFLIGLVQLAE